MGDDGGGTKSGGELVGRTVSFLSKRDGIDKLLKLAKYLSALGIEVGAGGNGANALHFKRQGSRVRHRYR